MNRPILIPIPKKVTWKEGNYNFCGNTINLYFDSLFGAGFENEIRLIEEFTGKEVKMCQLSEAKVVFALNSDFEEEEYQIEVDENKITITACMPVGVYRALTTLKQIYNQCGGVISCLTICDKPDIKFRQAQFDFRHRVPKIEDIKAYVQLLSDMKYNEYALYFESLGFYYSNFPQFYDGSKVFTPEDVRELDEFCKERYVKLIPVQASFGHMKTWLEQEELKDLGISLEGGGGSLNPLDPRSLELVEKIYDSILPHFSSDVVNICFDEVVELGTGKTAEAAQKEGKAKLFVDFLLKVSDLATKKYGKKVMFWGDMLYKYPEMWELVPADSTVMLWGYNAYEKYFDKHAVEIDAYNKNFYVCCSTNNFASFTGKTENALYNIKHAAYIINQYKNAKGILVTDWGDAGNPQFQPISYFGYTVGACYGWNSDDTIASEYDAIYSKWGAAMDGNWVNEFVAHAIQYASIDYISKVIFKCSNCELGHLLYRMGNYRYLEGENIGATTRAFEIFMGGFGADKINFPRELMKKISPNYHRSVVKYMQDIHSELELAIGEDDDTRLAIEEMKCNVRMVILMEEALVIQYYYLNDSMDDNLIRKSHELADEIYKMNDVFKSLWLKRNWPKGHEVAYYKFNQMANILKSLN